MSIRRPQSQDGSQDAPLLDLLRSPPSAQAPLAQPATPPATAVDLGSPKPSGLEFKSSTFSDVVVEERIGPAIGAMGSSSASGIGTANLGSVASQPKTALDVEAGGAPAPTAAVPQPQPSSAHFWEVEHYKPYFNVSTKDVLMRMLFSMFPINSQFISLIGDTADLYGTAWISTSLIFLMGVVANFASYLQYRQSSDHSVQWTYDFSKVTVACVVIYTYILLVPLLVFLSMRYFSVPVRFVEAMCVYGYGLTVFAATAVLCVVPSEGFRWAVVMLAFALSSIFIIQSLVRPFWSSHMPKQAPVLSLILVGIQLALAMGFKFFFFEYKKVDM